MRAGNGLCAAAMMLSLGLGANAAPVSYTGSSGGNWSVDGNWSGGSKPTGADDVTVGTTSVVDENFTLKSLTVNNTVTLSQTGGSALTVTNLVMAGGTYSTLSVPIALNAAGLFTRTAGAGFTFSGGVSGPYGLTIDGVACRWTFPSGNNTFTGDLDVEGGYISVSSATTLGRGDITFGSGDGSKVCRFFANLGTYSSLTNTITVAAGTGDRSIYYQMNNGTAVFVNDWVFDKALTVASHGPGFGNNTTIALNGDISGTAGIVAAAGGSSGNYTIGNKVILGGTCTYDGQTRVENGTVTVDGSLGNGDIEVNPNGYTNETMVLDGSGTITFNDGETVMVRSNALMDTRGGMTLDLTQLSGKTNTLVDFTEGAFTNDLANFQDLMTTNSAGMGMVLYLTNDTLRTEAGTPVLTPPDVRITWTNAAPGVWSNPDHWDPVGSPSNKLAVMGVAVNSTIDESYTLQGLILSNAINSSITINASGGSTLTCHRFEKNGASGGYPALAVPVTFDADTTVYVAGGGFNFSGSRTGTNRLTASGRGRVQFTGNSPSFTGPVGMEADDGQNFALYHYRTTLDCGPITLCRSGGTGNAGLFPGHDLTQAYTNLITVAAGTGWGYIYSQHANKTITYTCPFNLIGNLKTRVDHGGGLSGNTLVLSGSIGGTGGLICAGTDRQTTILTGTNTYTGTTTVQMGRLTVNGKQGCGDITIDAGATLDGSGTIGFLYGDVITVNGTNDASSLTVDLTTLASELDETVTLVDYSGGTCYKPTPLSNLLTSESADQRWILTDTGSEINAVRPSPGGTIISVN